MQYMFVKCPFKNKRQCRKDCMFCVAYVSCQQLWFIDFVNLWVANAIEFLDVVERERIIRIKTPEKCWKKWRTIEKWNKNQHQKSDVTRKLKRKLTGSPFFLSLSLARSVFFIFHLWLYFAKKRLPRWVFFFSTFIHNSLQFTVQPD